MDAAGFFGQFVEPLLVLDQSWKISYANPAAQQLFQKCGDHLLGSTLWSHWPENLQNVIEHEHRREFNESRHVHVAYPCKEQSIQWLELRIYQCEFGIVAHYRDITGPRRMVELEHRLSAIVQSADDAIISKDLNGTITSWNRAAEKLFGYTADEIIGKPIATLAAPDVKDEMPKILNRIRQGEMVDRYETKRMTKDGRILTVSLTVSPLRDASGDIVGASKVARDVTDQKKALDIQERLAAIVQSSDDAIISKDLNGIITSWNPGAEKLFGYTAEEIVGKPITTLSAPDVVDEIPNILDRLRQGQMVDHYQTKRMTKDGRILTVSLTVSPLRDAAGNVIGASKVARDITDRERQNRALREANEALTRANEDLQQFAYSASHDLQEPLRMVCIYSELLKKRFAGKLGAEGEDYLSFTVEGALRMEQLLKDLRAYTRATTAEQEPAADISAERVLEKSLASFRSLIDESGAVIDHEPLPIVRIHEFQLLQVFQNLIGNALRYRSDEVPHLVIKADRRGKEWLFSFRDNGIGIDPQYKEEIFGIFKRLHTNSDYPGTGMGLAICQRIIQRSGGRIWVGSELGKGSTFFFTLPAHDQ
jgi:PAS domain S-box-containing protein